MPAKPLRLPSAGTSPNEGCWGQKVVRVNKGVVFNNKAPLCKGGWRPKGDWGIVFYTN